MKEIKAYVHRTRIADVIEAVKATSAWATRPGDAGQHNLTVYAVQGSLVPIGEDAPLVGPPAMAGRRPCPRTADLRLVAGVGRSFRCVSTLPS